MKLSLKEMQKTAIWRFFAFLSEKIAVAIQERWNNPSTLFFGCVILIISDGVNDHINNDRRTADLKNAANLNHTSNYI
ncbi:MAG: hypothetical protein CVU99_10625 [Firmicutes bacterium HGW-Firmicutes-4]|jgi:hypothetical protein|nr:MAG: hypothetical protein CVU99_10625 [Firmicutes bacterium HGW-Firmicutes-4]